MGREPFHPSDIRSDLGRQKLEVERLFPKDLFQIPILPPVIEVRGDAFLLRASIGVQDPGIPSVEEGEGIVLDGEVVLLLHVVVRDPDVALVVPSLDLCVVVGVEVGEEGLSQTQPGDAVGSQRRVDDMSCCIQEMYFRAQEGFRDDASIAFEGDFHQPDVDGCGVGYVRARAADRVEVFRDGPLSPEDGNPLRLGGLSELPEQFAGGSLFGERAEGRVVPPFGILNVHQGHVNGLSEEVVPVGAAGEEGFRVGQQVRDGGLPTGDRQRPFGENGV